jgi:uncharacterized membrane protein
LPSKTQVSETPARDIHGDEEANASASAEREARGAAFGRALGMGVVAGLRTAIAPLSVSRAYRHGTVPLNAGGFLGLLTKRWIKPMLKLNALAEMIVDKTSWAPSRVQPLALGPRLASGTGVGLAVYRGAGQPAWRGAVLGTVGTLLGSYAGHRARAFAVKSTGQPDVIFALCEDAIAVGSGRFLLRRPFFGVLLALGAAAIAVRLPAWVYGRGGNTV